MKKDFCKHKVVSPMGHKPELFNIKAAICEKQREKQFEMPLPKSLTLAPSVNFMKPALCHTVVRMSFD